ncbi:MFS transporter, partial [Haemophilus haemoglobinophilus]|nr:MFS transporter [Canicola haemoglobinophilus]
MNEQITSKANNFINLNYWVFSAYFFIFFFIMATCYPFLGIWLGDIHGLKGAEIGYVFSAISLFALIFQPILGYLSDKLGIRKHLLWVVGFALLFYAPFFIYIFAPLLKSHLWLGIISGGVYMGFVFQAGAPASE